MTKLTVITPNSNVPSAQKDVGAKMNLKNTRKHMTLKVSSNSRVLFAKGNTSLTTHATTTSNEVIQKRRFTSATLATECLLTNLNLRITRSLMKQNPLKSILIATSVQKS